LLNRYTGQNLYPGFESLPHRQISLALQASVVPASQRARRSREDRFAEAAMVAKADPAVPPKKMTR
jgi:hypothetical protein